jgi:hypothetical protein
MLVYHKGIDVIVNASNSESEVCETENREEVVKIETE